MSVRFIEAFFPSDALGKAHSAIEELDVLAVWSEQLEGGQAALHIIAEAECSETITDALRNSIPDSDAQLRVVSLAVESSIPSPELFDDDPGTSDNANEVATVRWTA